MTLYESHYRSLCQSAARLLGSLAAAEDVVQEAFVRYQLATVQPAVGSELSYLRSIVLNSARSVLRRRATARNYVVAVARSEVCDRGEWLNVFGLDLILRAVRSLPERQRQVVVYRVVLDYSESDTARVMSISTGAVKTHLSRARDALRSEMQDWVRAS